MRIGIIGSRHPALVLAERWATGGHEIALSGPGDDSSRDALVSQIGPSARTASINDAAHFGDVIVLTISSDESDAFPSAVAVSGKIVIDAMDAPGEEANGADQDRVIRRGGAAERFSQSKMVKAFNTLSAEIMRAEARPSAPSGERFVVFLAGDDGQAKMTVSRLIEETGFTPIDTGSLAFGGALLRPGSEIYGKALLPAEARRILSLIA
jgi:predicted dinucleotide-binding enzyme